MKKQKETDEGHTSVFYSILLTALQSIVFQLCCLVFCYRLDTRCYVIYIFMSLKLCIHHAQHKP